MSTYFIWFIATAFAFFQFFLQTATGVIGVEWQRDFHLTNVQLSSLSSAFFYTYAFMQIPAGLLFDRFQPRYILGASASVLTGSLLLLSHTDSYSIAFLARLLMGAGSAFGFIGLLQVCASNFPPKRFAFMVGISEGFTMSSVMFSIMLLNFLVTHFTWRETLTGCSGVTFILSLATFFFIRTQAIKPHLAAEKAMTFSILHSLKIIFTSPQVILCSIYSFFMFAIVNAFASLWGVPFLMATNELSKQNATNMVAIIFLGIGLGGPLIGWIAKVTENPRLILITCAGLSTLIMSLIIFSPALPPAALYILFLLEGAFCSAYIQSFAIIKDAVPHEIRATALATSNMIIMLGAPILQLTIGYLLQTHFFGLSDNMIAIYRMSLAILPIGMLIAFILAFFIG